MSRFRLAMTEGWATEQTPAARALGAFTLALTLTAAAASAAPQVFWQEYAPGPSGNPNTGPFPADAATTFNNNRAGVRWADPGSNTDVLSFWQLTGTGLPAGPIATFGGSPWKSGSQTQLGNGFWSYQPSDRIEMNNTRSVSIGSGNSGNTGNSLYPGDDETYIEIVNTTSLGSVPAALPCFQIVISSDPATSVPLDWLATRAGDANDLEITRDGAWAVVNSNNWIHIVDPAWGVVAASFNIGNVDYSTTPPTPNWNRPCTPNHAVDSVAVSNDRAVVTTARFNTTLNSYTTWVYIVDLSTQPASIALQHEILPSDFAPMGDDFDWPHDVAITYDYQGVGQLAIVTTTHTVAAYDLVSNVFRNLSFVASDRRAYQKQVDSVEVTEKVAVVIADDYSTPGTPTWHVQVFALSLTGGLQLPPMADYRPANPEPIESHAHDLAIDKDFDKAIVRTSADNVIVLSMLSPPLNPLLLPSPNSSDAYAYEGFRGQSGLDVFSSDSVVISPPLNGTLMAATIGGNQVSQLYHGYVDLIDLAAPTPVVNVQIDITPDPQGSYGCVPLDLAVSHDHTEVVIRSADPTNSTTLPADLVFVSLTDMTGVINARFGGHGAVMGLDSLAVPASGGVNTTKRVLSIEQDPNANLGFVHVAH